ncbi:MAG TPA: CHAT domain-containing protein [Thermoanaerobaculia bacterium]|jgi:tetratricopeptide (TPR) repeat protein|nr:CHAT domain-containing protein [Thermoanaerobaculia bacterium]
MPPRLQLHVTDFKDDSRWSWELRDEKGAYLGDHEVKIDRSAAEARGFFDLPNYLKNRPPDTPPEESLQTVGEWMGRQVFGAVVTKIGERLDFPATVVRVHVPKDAQALLQRPFELAHLDGRPLAEAGVRFVYQLAQLAGTAEPKRDKPASDRLRVLAVFSLPHGQNPLNLRRERVDLEKLLKNLSQTRSATVELRVLQYGATRQTLKDALLEGAGWDLIHFSGHGLRGELVLEDERGEADRIDAEDLAKLLRPAKRRLKLLTLSSCLSGAASLAAARRQIGLDEPTREAAVIETKTEGASSSLPSLGQSLAEDLDCAVLAMRYSVGDTFAREAVLSLYEMLLEKGQPLPAALQAALEKVLDPEEAAWAPPLSLVTPILFGPRAADLTLPVPRTRPNFDAPQTGMQGFPPPPERFVGRLLPMLRASKALAPDSDFRGILFHGMAGAGKTACALELAWRHENGRFPGLAWSKAPDLGQDIASALTNFALDLERQLPELALVGLLDDSQEMRTKALPRLKGLLQNGPAILIVIDNLESLLTESGGWRDGRWGELIKTLLDHSGASRVVLTSRVVPTDLANHPALLLEPIHALSLPESVLLAKELPHLALLFGSTAGRERIQRILAAAQGHPKLLELADGLQGSDPEALDRQLTEETLRGSSFFTKGESDQGPSAFLKTLEAWTVGITTNLPDMARLVFHVLCRLEEADRFSSIIMITWPHILNRLRETSSEPEHDLAEALDRLSAGGLVETQRLPNPEGAGEALFRIHPAVAETGRQEAGSGVCEAVDWELGDFWAIMALQSLETEMQEGSRRVLQRGIRGLPYLLRAKRWEAAGALLEQVIVRDHSPGTLAMALPLLRVIAAAIRETPDGLAALSLLANVLSMVGRYREAEAILRNVVEACERERKYQQGFVAAVRLVNILQNTGRFEETLKAIERSAELTRRGGLGPWAQLLVEGMRLQVLAALGRHEVVLAEVERLRSSLEDLPEPREDETVSLWNVRETLLDIGSQSAMMLARREDALSLVAEILRSQTQRGADEVELARTKFNQHFPLLGLGRFQEAREVLESCRRVFEEHHDVAMLSKVFTALADLEYHEMNPLEAAKFAKSSLRLSYQVGEPEYCAMGHNNLGTCLERTQAAPEEVLAHLLAAGAMRFQISSEMLGTTLGNLAHSSLPSSPPPFEEVARRVEEIDGVHFRELFERLPKRAPDGDAAIAEVWRLVQERRDGGEATGGEG